MLFEAMKFVCVCVCVCVCVRKGVGAHDKCSILMSFKIFNYLPFWCHGVYVFALLCACVTMCARECVHVRFIL